MLPNARYVEIAECGHFPSLEAPEETADAIHHWLVASGLADDKTGTM
jgi:pimeloyl-ACP methyl ester carboxylesterase